MNEEIGLPLKIKPCKREAFGSIIGMDTCHPGCGVSRDFPQFLQENTAILPRQSQDHFLPNPFQFTIILRRIVNIYFPNGYNLERTFISRHVLHQH
jgi:hypothetical protein